MTLLQLILVCAVSLVIIALSVYVGILLSKLKANKLHYSELLAHKQLSAEQGIAKRNSNIVDSIRFIATATAQKQCNLSEAAIRISVLLETLHIPVPINVSQSYPALSALYEKVKDMPTHSERNNCPVKELKLLDAKRALFEAEMEEAVLREAQQLTQFSIE